MSSSDFYPVGDRYSVPNDGMVKKPPDDQVKAQEVLKIPQITLPDINLTEVAGSLKNRISPLFTDFNWSRLALNAILISSLILTYTTLGNSAIPLILGIVAAPFFLKPALQLSKDRFSMTKESNSLSKRTDSVFWGARTIGIFGMAVDNIRGAVLGLTLIPVLTSIAVLSHAALPITMLAISSISLFAESWAATKTLKSRRELKQLKEESDKATENYYRLKNESDKSLKVYNQFQVDAKEALEKHKKLEEKASDAYVEMRLALQELRLSNTPAQSAKVDQFFHSYNQLKEESNEAFEIYEQLKAAADKYLEQYAELRSNKDLSLEKMASALQHVMNSKTTEQTLEMMKEANRNLIEYLSDEKLEKSDKDVLFRFAELSSALLDPEAGSELKLIEESRALLQEVKTIYEQRGAKEESIQQLSESQKKLTELKLEEYLFQDQHSTSTDKRIALQGRVSAVLKDPAQKQTANKANNIFQTLKKDFPSSVPEPLTSQVREISTEGLSEFELVEKVLPIYDQLESFYREVTDSRVKRSLASSIDEIRVHRQELETLKGALLEKGSEVLETAQSEIDRRLMIHALFILFGVLSITAKILMLIPSPHLYVSTALLITLLSLDVMLIISDLSISQDKFSEIHRFFHSQKKSSVVDTDELDTTLKRREAMRRGQEDLA